MQTWRASGEGDLGLFYVRDKEKREVDFLVTERRRPMVLVECKSADEGLSKSLVDFQGKLEVPTAVQIVRRPGICKKTSAGRRTQWVVSADRWLGLLA